MLPFARDWPDVVVAAGGAVVLAVAEHADIGVLERLYAAIPEVGDRDVELDPVDAVITESLIDSRLDGATREIQAELRADLGIRLARAGRFGSARRFTEQAVEKYEGLAMARPRDFLSRHADAVL